LFTFWVTIGENDAFGWLRPTGYPAYEKSLYKHPWVNVDTESSGAEQDESGDLNSGKEVDVSIGNVDEWPEVE
jgi:hypothetical protein